MWDGFINDVGQRHWNHTPDYSHPTFLQYGRLSCEETVRFAFDANVLMPLSMLTQGEEIFGRYTLFDSVEGQPDFIQGVPKRKLRLIIEVKTMWSLSEDNLVTAWAQDLVENPDDTTARSPIYHHLRQIFGYLSANQLQFGVITTYQNTWFLRRPTDNPGELQISPVIRWDNQQPTLFQCFHHLTLLAREKHDCALAPPTPPPPLMPPSDSDTPPDNERGDPSYKDGGQKRKRSSRNVRGNTNKRSKGSNKGGVMIDRGAEHERLEFFEKHPHLEFFDWGSYKVLDVLGKGRSGTVFKAILHGEIVALKVCDLWQHPDYEKELLNEVEVYHALKDLQGYCIPRLKGAGYTAGGLFAIATDIVGSPLEDVESLSDQELRIIQSALLSIHQHGFVHKDIHCNNILVKYNGNKFHASFIDFAFSGGGSSGDFQKEMRSLMGLLKTRKIMNKPLLKVKELGMMNLC